MGFKTYTCVICGKEGLTKPQSYSFGNGRACRCHEEAESLNQKRKDAEEAKRKARQWDCEISFEGFFRRQRPIIPYEHLDDRFEVDLIKNCLNIFRKGHDPLCIYDIFGSLEVILFKENDLLAKSILHLQNVLDFLFEFTKKVNDNGSIITRIEEVEFFWKAEMLCTQQLEVMKKIDDGFKTANDLHDFVLTTLKRSADDFCKSYIDLLKRAMLFSEDSPERVECDKGIMAAIKTMKGEYDTIVSCYKNSRFEDRKNEKIDSIIAEFKKMLGNCFESYSQFRQDGYYIFDFAKFAKSIDAVPADCENENGDPQSCGMKGNWLLNWLWKRQKK